MLVKTLNADKLKVNIYDGRDSMGAAAARYTAEKINETASAKETVNIIFASAPSQNEFLAHLLEEKGIDWGKINAFHMDEYVNLPFEAPQSFGGFLKVRLFDRVRLKSVNYFDGNAGDLSKECKRYAKLLNDNPVDIVIMGIGENGHLAFNDPPVARFDDPETVKVVELDEKCIKQQVNDGCFSSVDQVPTRALTITIPALLKAKYKIPIVPGPTKQEAIKATIEGPISTQCPASILRTQENAVLFTDIEAAALLDLQ
jgi:glucosamine-6-phosphate deaminase